MTASQWHLVEEDPAYTVAISPEGRQKLADELRMQSRDRCTEIRVWTVAACVVVIAALVIKQILGN